MTYNYAKPTTILASSLAMFMTFSGMSYVFADDNNDFVSVNAERIKNDPMLAKILENIEKSRQEFSDIQQKTDHEKLIDDQRTIAKNILQQEVEQMFKDNEYFTSLAAFSNFLKTVSDENTKTIFQGLFDYKEDKINSARSVMGDVLRNGGSLQDARDAYHKALQIPRSDMIQLVKELNIQSGFSNSNIQDHFDGDGKLPRYENEHKSAVSFVSLTTSAKNVNTSLKPENIVVSTNDTESKDVAAEATDGTTAEATLIQKLLDEIRILKDKIAELEKSQNSEIQQAVLGKNTDSTVFADWVSDYYQGSGHKNSQIPDIQSLPTNVLHQPNFHENEYNSLTLGGNGQVILGFSEPVTDKLIIYETSTEKNLQELASVEVSLDGENWFLLKETQYHHDSSYVHEYSYDLSEIGCVTHVRITDQATSHFGDGFDVDGVGASKLCADTT